MFVGLSEDEEGKMKKVQKMAGFVFHLRFANGLRIELAMLLSLFSVGVGVLVKQIMTLAQHD